MTLPKLLSSRDGATFQLKHKPSVSQEKAKEPSLPTLEEASQKSVTRLCSYSLKDTNGFLAAETVNQALYHAPKAKAMTQPSVT